MTEKWGKILINMIDLRKRIYALLEQHKNLEKHYIVKNYNKTDEFVRK